MFSETLLCFFSDPGLVRNLTLSELSTTSFVIDWSTPDGGPSSYIVKVLGFPAVNKQLTTDYVNITGLMPGNYYTIQVFAQDGVRLGEATTIPAFTVPDVVKNLSATNVTTQSVFLSWLRPEGNMSSYVIEVIGEPSNTSEVQSESLPINTLKPGNLYTFVVSVLVADNPRRGERVAISEYTVPDVVRNLSATNVTTQSVFLSWLRPEGNMSSYVIEVIGEPSNTSEVQSESLPINALIPGYLYTFVVSVLVADNPRRGERVAISEYTVPDVVRNLSATNVTTQSVFLSWLRPEGNMSSYVIEVIGEPSNTSEVQSESLPINALKPGHLYTFVVSVLVTDNPMRGEKVAISEYTVPDVVRNLSATNVTTQSVFLSWLRPEGNMSSYVIEVIGEPSNTSEVQSESLLINALIPGNLYTFVVSVLVTDNPMRGERVAISEYTVPDVVRNLSATNVTTQSVFLSWLRPEGNLSSYVIEVIGEPSNTSEVQSESLPIKALKPGNLYTFVVSVLVTNNPRKGKKVAISGYTVPDVVKNLSATNVTTQSVFLSWLRPEGNMSSYVIEVIGEPSNTSEVQSESLPINTLKPGNLYTFVVSVLVADNPRRGERVAISEYTVPDVVRNLSATNVTTQSVFLSWLRPEGNMSSYVIEVIGEPSNTSEVQSESLPINALKPGNVYTFVVSVLVTDNPMRGERVAISEYTVPDVVRNLSATNVTTQSVFLSWLRPEGNMSSYVIEVIGEPSNTSEVQSESLLINALKPGNLYTFVVSVLVTDNPMRGERVAISEYTVPDVVRNLSATNVTTQSVFLSWLRPEGNLSSYVIEVIGEPSNTSEVQSESLPIKALKPGNVYTFVVSVLVTNNPRKGKKVAISGYTVPDVVRNLSATNVTTQSVFLSWLRPEGNMSSYVIEVIGEPSNTSEVKSESLLINALKPGNLYTFVVSVLVTDNPMRGERVAISEYTVPDVVRNLSATNATTQSVFLSWLRPEGNMSSYVIEVIGEPSKTVEVQSESVLINTLEPGTLYTFVVSILVTDNPMRGERVAISEYTVPNVPNNLIISNFTNDTVSLSWLPPTGNKSHYLVQVLGIPFSSNTTDSEFLTIFMLIPGNLYTFLVSAVAGNGIKGEDSSITFSGPKDINMLRVVQASIDSLALSWLPPVGSKRPYFVNVSGDPASNDTVENESVTIYNLIPGNLYTVSVSATAEDGSLQEKGSTISTYTKPNITNNLNVSEVSTTWVYLRWHPPTGNRSSYSVEVLGEPAKTMKPNTESVVVENLTPGNFYTFSVSAVSGDGSLSGDISSVSTFTVPDTILNLRASQDSIDSVSLNWLPPHGNKSAYMVQVLENPSTTVRILNESVILHNLVPGNLYTFIVWALSGNYLFQGNITSVTFRLPVPISNLTVTEVSINSVSLSWLQPTGNISSYLVEVFGAPSTNVTMKNTTVSIPSLVPGNCYTFYVSAVLADGSFQTEKASISTYTVPDIVRNLTASNITTQSVFLNWLHPEGNMSSYVIQVLGDPSKTIEVQSESAHINALTPGNLYTFVISVLVKDNPMRGKSVAVSEYTVPDVVRTLTASIITTQSVFLSWLHPEGNMSSYVIEVLGDPSKTIEVQSDSALINALTPGNLYTFVISVLVKDNPMRGKSVAVSAYTVPDVVRNLTASNITTQSIFLSWLHPEGNMSSYAIEFLGDPSKTIELQSESALINALTPGNLYTFVISVLVKDNPMRGNSVAVSAYTVPDIVRNLTASNITTQSVFLSWLHPEGNMSSYVIEVLGDPSKTIEVQSESALINALTPGNLYTFVISVLVKDNPMRGKIVAVSAYTVPDVVRNPTASNITTQSVFLSWLHPEGNMSSYVIEVLGDPSKTIEVQSESAPINALTPGNLYTFVISVLVKDNPMRGKSVAVSAYTVPDVVRNLTASNITTQSIFLSWLRPDGNMSANVIDVIGDPSKTIEVQSESALINGLTPGNLYTFVVSVRVTDNPMRGKSVAVSEYTVPDVVKNLSAINITTHSVILTWLPSDGNRSSYSIQVIGEPSTSLLAPKESVLIEALTPGNLYTFLVSVLVTNNPMSGKNVSISKYTVPDVVKNLSVINVTMSSAFLSWLPPAGNMSSYLIEVRGEPSSTREVRSESFLIEGLNPGNLYTFLVSVLVTDNPNKGESVGISKNTAGGLLYLSVQVTTTLTAGERQVRLLEKLKQRIEGRFPGLPFNLKWLQEKNKNS
ncbi:tenascin-X-like isoform X1 [Pleurodeles waltl]|uniref:tenascin-X-like isoform X1 n=1 Tax=Pleurodeles waltl TaxID=8319 RepID=UPI0037096E6F